MNKEDIYDERINPLMTQVIAICKENNIALFLSAHIPNDEDPDLACITHLPGDNDEFYEPFAKAFGAVRSQNRPVMYITTTHPDGGATLEAII